jgi:transposase
LDERALRERLRRRSHLVRLRTSAQNRIFGLQTQWGLRLALSDIPREQALQRLAEQGMPETWRRSVAEALEVIDLLDGRLVALERELNPLAKTDPRVQLLRTIPGIGWLLGLTIASEISDIARFPNAGKLVGYAGLSPRIKQSGQSSRTGPLSKAGSRTLRWAASTAAQHAWRESNPWHQLYLDLSKRAGKNPAKSAVARKILIASWHVLQRQEPFKPSRPRGREAPVPASSISVLAA